MGPRALATAALLAAVAGSALMQPATAEARPADPFRYDISYEDFAVCDTPASLEGRVFLVARSTGAESGNYSSTFIERTVGTLTVGDTTYRYHQSSVFSELEPAGTYDSRTQRLAGSIRLAGSGPFAGVKLQQRIHLVTDATGEVRVDTSVSSFCT
jgi:hypothetical protein